MKMLPLIACTAFLVSCADVEQPSGRTENVMEVHAVVRSVDLPGRTVDLSIDGEDLALAVDESVGGLDQIRAGDNVVVSYTEALAWKVKPAAKGAPGISVGATASTSRPGGKPGESFEQNLTITTTITAIDAVGGTVTLTGPKGRSMTVKPQEPRDLARIHLGDLVDLTYSQAVAVAIRRDPRTAGR